MKRILGTYMFPLKQFVCDCCEKESAVTSSKSSKLPAGWIEVNENHYCSACVKRDQQIREAATIASKKFRYRDLHIPAMSGFVEGAKWADKYLNYESEVMFRLPNGNIEICTIEKLITMHNNLLMIVESRTVAGAFRRLDKAVCDWKDSVRGSLSSLTTRFIRKTNNETAE